MKKREILLTLSDGDFYYSMAIRSALEEKGYQVIMANSYDSAVKATQANHFDLVITDLSAVLEKVKERHPETMGILVLATRNTWDPVARAIRSSPDDCLFKPFELQELEMRVNHCFERLELLRRSLQPEGCEERPDKETSNMARVISHDIRGGLFSVSATLKLLSRGHYGKMDEEVMNRIKELYLKTVGLIGITQEYLANSFSSDNDSGAEGEELDLMKDILIPVLKEFSLELEGHHLIIDPSLHAMPSRRISLQSNRVLLKMVFRNLLKNAIRHGDERRMITLGFEDQGSSFQFSIYKSRSPIPEEYQGKLFTTSIEIRNRDCENDGTEFGLYLTKMVIQKLGGNIWCEAREDGSNFVFTLPTKPAFSADLLPPVGARA
jgi:K+-sensing histidine kinase KdpD